MNEIQRVMNVCNFRIDAYHIPIDYRNWEETLSVVLTDEEYNALRKTRKKLQFSGVWYACFPEVDEEYYLKTYFPEIHAKVRQTLQEKAPLIWDERILSYLDKVGIYIVDGEPIRKNEINEKRSI